MKVVVAVVLAESLPVPVTVTVYAPDVVPGFAGGGLVPLELEPPPQPAIAPKMTATISRLSIDFHSLLRLGTHNTTSTARTTPERAAVQPFGPTCMGKLNAMVLAAVVLTLMVAVPDVVPALSVTAWLLVQDGGSTAPAGLEVTLQVKLMVPA